MGTKESSPKSLASPESLFPSSRNNNDADDPNDDTIVIKRKVEKNSGKGSSETPAIVVGTCNKVGENIKNPNSSPGPGSNSNQGCNGDDKIIESSSLPSALASASASALNPSSSQVEVDTIDGVIFYSAEALSDLMDDGILERINPIPLAAPAQLLSNPQNKRPEPFASPSSSLSYSKAISMNTRSDGLHDDDDAAAAVVFEVERDGSYRLVLNDEPPARVKSVGSNASDRAAAAVEDADCAGVDADVEYDNVNDAVKDDGDDDDDESEEEEEDDDEYHDPEDKDNIGNIDPVHHEVDDDAKHHEINRSSHSMAAESFVESFDDESASTESSEFSLSGRKSKSSASKNKRGRGVKSSKKVSAASAKKAKINLEDGGKAVSLDGADKAENSSSYQPLPVRSSLTRPGPSSIGGDAFSSSGRKMITTENYHRFAGFGDLTGSSFRKNFDMMAKSRDLSIFSAETERKRLTMMDMKGGTNRFAGAAPLVKFDGAGGGIKNDGGNPIAIVHEGKRSIAYHPFESSSSKMMTDASGNDNVVKGIGSDTLQRSTVGLNDPWIQNQKEKADNSSVGAKLPSPTGPAMINSSQSFLKKATAILPMESKGRSAAEVFNSRSGNSSASNAKTGQKPISLNYEQLRVADRSTSKQELLSSSLYHPSTNLVFSDHATHNQDKHLLSNRFTPYPSTTTKAKGFLQVNPLHQLQSSVDYLSHHHHHQQRNFNHNNSYLSQQPLYPSAGGFDTLPGSLMSGHPATAAGGLRFSSSVHGGSRFNYQRGDESVVTAAAANPKGSMDENVAYARFLGGGLGGNTRPFVSMESSTIHVYIAKFIQNQLSIQSRQVGVGVVGGGGKSVTPNRNVGSMHSSVATGSSSSAAAATSNVSSSTYLMRNNSTGLFPIKSHDPSLNAVDMAHFPNSLSSSSSSPSKFQRIAKAHHNNNGVALSSYQQHYPSNRLSSVMSDSGPSMYHYSSSYRLNPTFHHNANQYQYQYQPYNHPHQGQGLGQGQGQGQQYLYLQEQQHHRNVNFGNYFPPTNAPLPPPSSSASAKMDSILSRLIKAPPKMGSVPRVISETSFSLETGQNRRLNIIDDNGDDPVDGDEIIRPSLADSPGIKEFESAS